MAEIQIRAEVLRRADVAALQNPLLGFGPLPEAVRTGRPDMNVRKLWRERDLSRAIAAAEKVGLRSYRVEIAPDGTIAIVVDSAAEAPALCPKAVAANG